MNITGLIFLGTGYLLGNPPARQKFAVVLQQLAGRGIDALNNIGNSGGGNVNQPVSEPEE